VQTDVLKYRIVDTLLEFANEIATPAVCYCLLRTEAGQKELRVLYDAIEKLSVTRPDGLGAVCRHADIETQLFDSLTSPLVTLEPELDSDDNGVDAYDADAEQQQQRNDDVMLARLSEDLADSYQPLSARRHANAASTDNLGASAGSSPPKHYPTTRAGLPRGHTPTAGHYEVNSSALRMPHVFLGPPRQRIPQRRADRRAQISRYCKTYRAMNVTCVPLTTNHLNGCDR
jgi:hypothetical protein